MTDNEENLPAVLREEFPCDALPAKLPEDDLDKLDVVQPIDIRQIQYTFRRLGDAWQKADSIDDIAKCMAMTYKAIETRRNALLLPNAHQRSSKQEGLLVTPLP